jgi:hypothetical protein
MGLFLCIARAQLGTVPTDSLALTKLMHERGINLRYLGRVHAEATKAGLLLVANLCKYDRAFAFVLACACKTQIDTCFSPFFFFLVFALRHIVCRVPFLNGCPGKR